MKFKYTGFKDSHGRKIFTDDVVSINGGVFRIGGTSKKYHLVNEWDRSNKLAIEHTSEGTVVDAKPE